MRAHWNWGGFAIAAAASAMLIVGGTHLASSLGAATTPIANAVDDRAELLNSAERTRIANYHAALRRTHDIDYRVLAIGTGAELERASYDYFEEAGVGYSSANGRGLLLVVDTASERVRLEVSTSLEGVYTDAFVAYVQSRQMAPFLAAGRVADGVMAATELIVARAQEADAGAEFAAPMTARSMGGGATAAASIGAAAVSGATLDPPTHSVSVGLDPLQVVEAYHERMASRDARADTSLFGSMTVAMLRNWIVTPAQMDHVVRTYRRCTVDGVRIESDTAVVRYRIDERQCAPYFLRREDDAWKLDLATPSSAIRFNNENEWRFQTPLPAPYAFAFADWRLDQSGFPHARR